MSVVESLIQHGLALRADGDDLQVQATQPLSQEQLNWLRNNKQRLLEELRDHPEEQPPRLTLSCATDLDLPLLRDDQIWIDEFINDRSPHERHLLLSEYQECWLASINAPNLLDHERENAGRYAANSWLRTKFH